MVVYLNDKSVNIAEGTNLAGLLVQEGLGDARGIAVALNNEVVPKTQWEKTCPKDSDKLTVIKATQGG